MKINLQVVLSFESFAANVAHVFPLVAVRQFVFGQCRRVPKHFPAGLKHTRIFFLLLFKWFTSTHRSGVQEQRHKNWPCVEKDGIFSAVRVFSFPSKNEPRPVRRAGKRVPNVKKNNTFVRFETCRRKIRKTHFHTFKFL